MSTVRPRRRVGRHRAKAIHKLRANNEDLCYTTQVLIEFSLSQDDPVPT
jgi:hypothetical protein